MPDIKDKKHYISDQDNLRERPTIIQFEEILSNVINESFLDGVGLYNKKGQAVFINAIGKKHGLPQSIASTNDLEVECYDHNGQNVLSEKENPFFRLMENEYVRNEEIWLKMKGKPVTILLLNGKPIKLTEKQWGYFILSKDITMQKWTEQCLKMSEQRYKSLYDYNPDIVCWLDLEGNFLHVNPATEKKIGLTLDQLIQQSFFNYVHMTQRDQTLSLFKKVIKGESQDLEITFLNNKGTSILHVLMIPMIVDSRVVGVYVLAKEVTQQKKMEEVNYYLSYHDILTGLPNRRFFLNELTTKLNNAKTYGEKLVLMFLDLDQFKSINDTFGHSAGDTLLKKVSERFKICLKNDEMLFRLGGDEFTIILPNRDKKYAEEVAMKLIETLSVPIVIENQEILISVSIGISLFPDNGKEMEWLLQYADRSMYEVKEHGKNHFRFYNQNMASASNESVFYKNEIHKAIVNKDFSLYYQPKFNIKTGELVGAEALIRWKHNEKGMISPAIFIPEAEKNGLIFKVGEWVIRTACEQNKQWQQNGYRPIPLAVNLSIKQFQQKNIDRLISGILQEVDLNPRFLELEITEGISADNMDEVSRKLGALDQVGMKITLDDFGIGFSSLNYLKHFPVDTIKIDKSFIQQATTSRKDAAIVQSILTMGHGLQLKVLAEGVETTEQLEFLKKIGCDEVQGYLYGHPVPASEFEIKYLGVT